MLKRDLLCVTVGCSHIPQLEIPSHQLDHPVLVRTIDVRIFSGNVFQQVLLIPDCDVNCRSVFVLPVMEENFVLIRRRRKSQSS